eukprot:162351-Pelagomonas_calceolata.AAC.1
MGQTAAAGRAWCDAGDALRMCTPTKQLPDHEMNQAAGLHNHPQRWWPWGCMVVVVVAWYF